MNEVLAAAAGYSTVTATSALLLTGGASLKTRYQRRQEGSVDRKGALKSNLFTLSSYVDQDFHRLLQWQSPSVE